MKKLIILCFWLGSFAASSQNIVWERTYSKSKFDDLRCLQPTSDCGYILGANTFLTTFTSFGDTAPGSREQNFWVVKCDSTGGIQWEKIYGGSNMDFIEALQPTLDGGYILGGYTRSSDGDVKSGNKGGADFWVVKINSEGEVQWEKTYGGAKDDYLWCIQPTSDGCYIIGGMTMSYNGDVKSGNNGEGDGWVLKIDSKGAIQWERTYGGSKKDEVREIQLTANGDYILCGSSQSSDGDVKLLNKGNYDFWMVSINSRGNILWEKTYGGSNLDCLSMIKLVPDKGYVLGGRTKSSDGDVVSRNEGVVDYWVVKVDLEGQLLWEKTYGGSSADVLSDIHSGSDGGFFLGGTTMSSDVDVKSGNKGGSDYWLVRINPEGEVLWEKTFGGSGDERLQCVQLSSNGGYLLGGITGSSDGDVKSNNKAGQGIWIVKVKVKE